MKRIGQLLILWLPIALYAQQTLETQLSAIVVPELGPYERRITLIEENLAQSDIGTLQARLATLGANLETIMQQQALLLDLRDRINENTDI